MQTYIDLILALFGNVKAMERLHYNPYTENKITNIKDEKIAESREGQVFSRFNELNGYHFMHTTILSHTNIKTFKGATLTFFSDIESFELVSDTQEFDSDFSKESNRWMTEIVFNVEATDIEKIRGRSYDQIQLKFKKKVLTFNTVN